jgi:hypothetical protein
MNRHYRTVLVATATFALCSMLAFAQSPKELQTKSGASVLLANLLNAKPDCSATPGPFVLPSLREKPANGIVQIQIIISDVAASGKCPARKVPSIALFYTPRKDFVGIDSIQIEVEAGFQTTVLSYRVTVKPIAEPL